MNNNNLINKYFYFVYFVLSIWSPSVSIAQHQPNQPVVHVLMPAYNANGFILSSIKSVLEQNYLNVKLLIFNDGSTDQTFKVVKKLLEDHSLKNKIYIKSTSRNKGVSRTRTTLIQWSKAIEPQAYIFWLDADDQYTNKFFIRDVIQQMQKTKADICLVNFSIIYEDEKQKSNSIGLIKEQEKMTNIIKTISAIPNQSIQPMNFLDLLEVTSLGWVKCYAPTVNLPQPIDCPFEDFVYMAALLEVNVITALPTENKSIQYLRRSTSICGKRKSKHFTNDIPDQLTKFFNTVLEHSMYNNEQSKKLQMAKNFVLRKLEQYLDILQKTIKAKSDPDINQNTLKIYRQKAEIIENYINEKIDIYKT